MSMAEKKGDGSPSLELMFRRTIGDSYRVLLWKILLLRFVLATRNIVALEDALDLAYSKPFNALITPNQIRNEIQALCEIVRQRRPRTVLEIGTQHGGTFFLFSRVAAPDALLVSVDLASEDMKPWRTLCTNLRTKRQSVSVIDGDSHATSTVEWVNRVLGDRKVDFLFIDGDHSYEGVRQDFENYVGFLNDPGLIAFHDINPDYLTRFGKRTNSYSGEVYQFWAEVKMKYSHAECIDNPDEDGFGIGILFIGSNAETEEAQPVIHNAVE
jgi:predicted O-methyltransferase YrrM